MQTNYRKTTVFFIFILSTVTLLWGCNAVDVAVSDPVPNCFDGIFNQDEVEIDCGGTCPNCPSKLTAVVNGMNWESAGSVTTQINGNAILISAGNANSNLSLIYTGPFTTGTYTLTNALYSVTSTNYTANTGSITFTKWDQAEKLIFGTFNFKAFEVTGSGDSVNVTQGKFTFVPLP
jgi:hypothetical protein